MPRVTAGDVELYYESLGEGLPLVLQAHDHHAAPREAAPAWNAAVQGFLDRHGLGGQSTR